VPDFPKRAGPDQLRTGAFCVFFAVAKKSSAGRNRLPGLGLISFGSEDAMLVERGLQAMHMELVSEAYAIAANYLRRSGVIPDSLVTDERLLGIIVKLLQHGEFNKIRLANKAIVRFEAQSEARAVA
jgi:hypothetical protein